MNQRFECSGEAAERAESSEGEFTRCAGCDQRLANAEARQDKRGLVCETCAEESSPAAPNIGRDLWELFTSKP